MKKKIVAGILLLLLSALPIGCGAKTQIVNVTQQLTAKHVLKVGGRNYTLSQAKVYLVNYRNLYGAVSGVDLWVTDSKHYLADYIKEMSVSQMTKILSMASLAEHNGIKLGDTELEAVKNAAAAYYKTLNTKEKNSPYQNMNGLDRLKQGKKAASSPRFVSINISMFIHLLFQAA